VKALGLNPSQRHLSSLPGLLIVSNRFPTVEEAVTKPFRPYGTRIIFPLYPALRLRLRAGLRLSRACGTGFRGSCSTVARSHWVS